MLELRAELINDLEAKTTTKRTNTKQKSKKLIFPRKRNSGKTGKTKKTNKHYTYELGPRHNNVRIIDTESVSSAGNIIGDKRVEFVNGRIKVEKINHNVDTPDGKIDSAIQAKRGDCYFIAEINSIKNSKDGQKILQKNIKNNKDGSITITLPGAIAIKNDYINRGLGAKCQVTGTYTITKAALEKAGKLQGSDYAKGDIEVVALELAMETYRHELVLTKKACNEKPGRYTSERLANENDSNDYLSGGLTYDSGFILTGQKSDYYEKKDLSKLQYFNDKKYERISRAEMERRTSSSGGIRLAACATKGISEVNFVTHSDSDFQKMLDKYQGHEDEYAITFGVKVAEKGPDGATKVRGGHALSVLKITDNEVYVANPWHPNQIQVIPRDEFEKMATRLTAQKMDEKEVAHTYTTNTMNSLINGSTPTLNISQQTMTQLQQVMNQTNNNVHTSSRRLTLFINHYNKITRKDLKADTMVHNLSALNSTKDGKELLQNISLKFDQNSKEEFTNEDVKKINQLFLKYCN